MLAKASNGNRLQWSDRRLLGRVATRLAPLALLAGLRCRLNAKGLASSVDHAPAPSLASLSSVSKATLRHAQARPPTVPPSYSVVKSFPALPIQQSKTVTIALSAGCKHPAFSAVASAIRAPSLSLQGMT
jgi:hypothetical protein